MKYRVGPDVPGHLKRLRAHYEYVAKMEEIDDPIERYELQLDWLSGYLTWPPGKFLKRVAIRAASKNEIDELIAAVTGNSIDPKKDDNSSGG
jgi:hypothetical protein